MSRALLRAEIRVADPTDDELLSLVKQALSGTLARNAAALRTATGRHVQGLAITDLIVLRKDLEARIAAAAGCSSSRPIRFRSPA
jgi:hypothetical protein